jgi:hypothetical protein
MSTIAHGLRKMETPASEGSQSKVMPASMDPDAANLNTKLPYPNPQHYPWPTRFVLAAVNARVSIMAAYVAINAASVMLLATIELLSMRPTNMLPFFYWKKYDGSDGNGPLDDWPYLVLSAATGVLTLWMVYQEWREHPCPPDPLVELGISEQDQISAWTILWRFAALKSKETWALVLEAPQQMVRMVYWHGVVFIFWYCFVYSPHRVRQFLRMSARLWIRRHPIDRARRG